jgi:RNA methyltransferase, TrmH family
VPGCVVEVFATVAATEQYAELVAAAPAWTLVDDRALASLSDSVTPAGVVGVCRFLDRPVEHVADGTRLLAICADVRDPGNAGTVIRCADAAGADGVVLAGHSVDVYNPKTVRASVGSLFHLPLAVEPDPAAAVRAAQAAGLQVLAADGAGEVDLDRAEELLAATAELPVEEDPVPPSLRTPLPLVLVVLGVAAMAVISLARVLLT